MHDTFTEIDLGIVNFGWSNLCVVSSINYIFTCKASVPQWCCIKLNDIRCCCTAQHSCRLDPGQEQEKARTTDANKIMLASGVNCRSGNSGVRNANSWC